MFLKVHMDCKFKPSVLIKRPLICQTNIEMRGTMHRSCNDLCSNEILTKEDYTVSC